MFRELLKFNPADDLTREQKQRARLRAIAVFIVSIIAVSVISVVITIAVRQDNNQNRSKDTLDTVKNLQQGVDLIISCNTPNGKCYKTAQDGRKARTVEIEQVIIATGTCREDGQDKSFQQLETCVMKYVNP